ncbi:hypothetical protein, partial [Pseudomonas helleri]|uniref:hypothetical protein n=1 Tax=Pseudomonas helleri TaxID=1608996 RepID=UPI001E622268
HLGLLALMAVYFTENRISWVYVQSLGSPAPKPDTRAVLLDSRPWVHPLKSLLVQVMPEWRWLSLRRAHEG